MKDFLDFVSISPDKISYLLESAVRFKAELAVGGNEPILKGKSLAMVFQKKSLRTRVSFELGMVHFGGHAVYLAPDEIGLGTRESAADVARVLSRYFDGIMARVYEHRLLVELAEHATVPIINGLSDYNHPAQIVSDLLTIREHCGRLQGIKLAYVGDGNNVARSLLFGAMKMGMHFSLGAPAGYTLLEDDYAIAREIQCSGAEFSVHEDPHAAVKDADIIYTDVWTSMGQEAESVLRRRIFPPYQVNAQLLASAKPSALVMHCLPAHYGEEITRDVLDGPQSIIFDQAENRLHAQKAVLADLLG